MDRAKAEQYVDAYMDQEQKITPTQEILDSGTIPRLKGYTVIPGKVSDSIVGGNIELRDGTEHENHPLYNSQGQGLRIMVRTPRISTHDVNRGEIPFKDQILAVNHNYMRNLVRVVLGTSQLDVRGLTNNSLAIVAENLTQIPIEMVLRNYMAKSSTKTSLFHHYITLGKRDPFAGHQLPEGLITNGKLPFLIDTPSTKAEVDETISAIDVVERGLATTEQYAEIRDVAFKAFHTVQGYLSEKGLILVDTKTEHGINSKGEIVSQDELYTMDSSRFWLSEEYLDQVNKLSSGEIEEIKPASFSKQFARDMIKDQNQGYTVKQIKEIAIRYMEGIELLTGQEFVPDTRPRDEQVISALETIVDEVVAY